jgi:putative spermidine/putrescine transport system permease protein
MGRISDALTLENYWRILSDDLYRRSLWLTFRLAAATALLDVVIALPTAYLLSRLRSRWFSALVVLLLISSFVSVVIRVLGLTIILGKEGPINRLLLGLGLLDAPLQLYSNPLGVLIGLVQFTLPIVTMLQVGILQTIPPSLEEAGEIHGARWLSVLGRVVLPLARPGLVAGGMIAFNMSMGAFTAAILLGGGVTITFPVLIQSKILHDVDYAMAAALSTFLVAVVFLINLGTALLLKPRRRAAAYAA